MISPDFLSLYEELDQINESPLNYKNGTVERGNPISLAKCRMIDSDVVDIRGEIERSACLVYNGVLTRVAAQALIFRDGADGGKEVLMRLWRSAVYLPGGGVDIDKDGTDATNTIHREVLEEINLTVSNVRTTNSSYWEYSEKPWVERHVAGEADRWNGYYTMIFTADYEGEGDNDLPEEAGRYRWHKVEDILARPDTKKMRFLKEAIIANGYNIPSTSIIEDEPLDEDLLNEERQIGGYVSYAVQQFDKKSPHALKALDSILSTQVILASTEEDGTQYVSTSRNLLSHLGTIWKCALILDGDKLTRKFKTKPINYNSQVYYAVPPEEPDAETLANETETKKQARLEREARQAMLAKSAKTLKLINISKFQALDDNGYKVPGKFFYTANLSGSGFKPDLPEKIYEILKTVLRSYNAEWVSDSGTGRQKAQNKNNYRGEISRFYELVLNTSDDQRVIKAVKGLKRNESPEDFAKYLQELEAAGIQVPNWLKQITTSPEAFDAARYPLNVGFVKSAGDPTLPRRHRDNSWVCIEKVGNAVGPGSGAYEIKQKDLVKYKDIIAKELGKTFPGTGADDVASWAFYKMLCGDYENEAEERIEAKDVDFYNVYGIPNKRSGVDISGCIKGILIDDKHRFAFIAPEDILTDETEKLYLHQDGILVNQEDDQPSASTGKRPIGLKAVAASIRQTAKKLNIPIILFDSETTNRDVVKLIDDGVQGVWARSARYSTFTGSVVKGPWMSEDALLDQMIYDIDYYEQQHKKGKKPELLNLRDRIVNRRKQSV